MYVPNATPSNTATFRMNATFRHYRTSCVPTGQQLGNCGLFTGAYLANALLVIGSQHLQPTVQIPIHFKVKLEVQEFVMVTIYMIGETMDIH